MEKDFRLEELCRIVREAGALIAPVTQISEMKAKKGTSNFVTKYDSLVQKTLIGRLSAFEPQAAFIGEEDGYSSRKITGGKTFIIDPIDGTTNFICGFLYSAVCVGLSDHGHMELGVVYNPFREEMFCAQRGHGAFLNGKKLQIPDCPLEKGLLLIDIAPYNPELRSLAFKKAELLSYHCMDIRDTGSAALSICEIACGKAAAYLSPRLCVWDYAAASLILSEAGGAVTRQDGSDTAFGTHIPVMAGTPSALARVRELLEENSF